MNCADSYKILPKQKIISMHTILSLCFGMIFLLDMGAGVETAQSIGPTQDVESVLTSQTPLVDQPQDVVVDQATGALPTVGAIRQVVKVLHDRATNRVMLVGSKEDVAIVKQAIESFNRKMDASPNPMITEKVKLKFQLAETVTAILTKSMELKSSRLTNLRADPIHFPESVLLVGPKDSVDRAKLLIESIDSHPGFSSK